MEDIDNHEKLMCTNCDSEVNPPPDIQGGGVIDFQFMNFIVICAHFTDSIIDFNGKYF